MHLQKALLRASQIFILSLLIVSALAKSSAPQNPTPQNNGFVIRNVRIFDGSRIIPKGDVWVQDGKIKAVGAELKAPARVRVVDGSGETLLPGLIDAHVHVFGDALKEALVFGVTTELDMFTDYHYAAQIKKEQAEGRRLDMADLRSAGTLVTAAKGHGTEYGMPIPTIASPDEAQAFVDARIAEGSDYIKIIYDDGKTYGINLPTISKETMAAVVIAAHRRGKLAVAHIGSLQGARDAIAAGVDGLMHLFVDAPPDPQFAAFVAQHHAFVVPTLSVLASIAQVPAGKSLAGDPRLQPYLSNADASNLGRSFQGKHGDLAFAQETIRQLRAHHVPVLAGTDAPNPGTAHGASMHEELELLVGSGMTPTEALAAATSVPAATFHLADRGQIAPGKRADLLLVKGDPTTDIKATRDIVAVWKLGVEEDRAAYRASLDKERQAAEAQKHAPAPSGSDSGLISDFDDGTTSAKFGSGWQVSTDSYMGGKSSAQMNVVEGGAEGSKKALQVTGEIVFGSVTWAGAMFFPGATPMAPVNLSRKKVISFWTKGDGQTYRVMVYAQSAGYIPKTQTFVAGPDWKKVTIPLSAFETDGHDLMGILFGAVAPPGHFTFLIDNVRLE
ncbi:MAG TPA: CIA30 family protein [Candidatus Angelobacter sp.]|nr:CIA30 family protein [Candidatus Angelobacter sp.]